MKDELDDLAGYRLKALISIEENKKRVAKWYDKKIKAKEFTDGDLVWKLILPIGTKSSKFGKWSPNWEGPYRINRSAPGNAYILETLEGVEFPRALNGKYLKKYYRAYGSMHKSLSADNIPIGWIKVCFGLNTMFQEMPITVLSARPKIISSFEERAKHATDEEFIHLVGLGWPI